MDRSLLIVVQKWIEIMMIKERKDREMNGRTVDREVKRFIQCFKPVYGGSLE